MYTLGADPELFLKRGPKFISAIGKIGGTKQDPRRLLGGFCLQEDNVAVEYNIPPCKSPDEFLWSHQLMLKEIEDIASVYDCESALVSSANFDADELADPLAQVFGCDPDYNAWDLEPNAAPQCDDKSLRSAGGHIHIGMDASASTKDKLDLVRCLDMILGVPLAWMDPESKRRALYGKAGACRMKEYGVEYRTPSNVWLRDPELILATANAIQNFKPHLQDYKKYCNENEKYVRSAINDLDGESFINLYGVFSTFWPRKILDKYIKMPKGAPVEHVRLIIE